MKAAVITHHLNSGQLISPDDTVPGETQRHGLCQDEIQHLQKNYYLLDRPLRPGETVTKNDFKKAKIAAIIAARMKSKRLPRKAVLPIHGRESVKRCLDNCLQFPICSDTILATSTLADDDILSTFDMEDRVKIWRGDPEDVISRYLGACRAHGIDVIVRATGDCPVVSAEIAAYLLRAHFASGADFTEPREFAVGTNSQIYNVETLERIINAMGRAEYSEHMTFYVTSNPDLFKVKIVDLPPHMIRTYRLTLDYQEDLEMFDHLFKLLDHNRREADLASVFKILDENPWIPEINSHKTLVYKTDKALIQMLKEKTRITRPMLQPGKAR